MTFIAAGLNWTRSDFRNGQARSQKRESSFHVSGHLRSIETQRACGCVTRFDNLPDYELEEYSRSRSRATVRRDARNGATDDPIDAYWTLWVRLGSAGETAGPQRRVKRTIGIPSMPAGKPASISASPAGMPDHRCLHSHPNMKRSGGRIWRARRKTTRPRTACRRGCLAWANRIRWSSCSLPGK